MALTQADIAVLVKVIDEATEPLKQITANVTKFTKVAATVTAAAAGFAYVVSKILESEKATRKLREALVGVGKDSGITVEQVDQLARKFTDISVFSVNEVRTASEQLIRFGAVTAQNLEPTLEITARLADQMDIDLPQAARNVANALVAPANASRTLRQYGVALNKEQQELVRNLDAVGRRGEAQKIILDELAKVTSGSSYKIDTFSKALIQTKNRFDELLGGGDSNKGMKGATEALQRFNQVLGDEQLRQDVDAIFTALITGFGKLVEVSTGFFRHLAELIGTAIIGWANLFEWIGHVGRAMLGLQTADDKYLADNQRLFEVTEKLVQQRAKLAEIEGSGRNKDRARAIYQQEIRELEKEQAVLKERLKAARAEFLGGDGGIGGDGAGGGGGKTSLGRLDEYERAIQQMIAKYGEPIQQLRAKLELELDDLSKSGLLDKDVALFSAEARKRFEIELRELEYMLAHELDSNELSTQIANRAAQRAREILAAELIVGGEVARINQDRIDAEDQLRSAQLRALTEYDRQLAAREISDEEYAAKKLKLEKDVAYQTGLIQKATYEEFLSDADRRLEELNRKLLRLEAASGVDPEVARRAIQAIEDERVTLERRKRVDDLRAEYDSEEARRFFDETFAPLQDSIKQFILNPFNSGLRDLAFNIIDTFRRAIAEIVAQRFMDSIGNNLINAGIDWVSGLFAPGRAGGGAITKATVVGEDGPEVVIPGMGGASVLNMRQLAFAGGNTAEQGKAVQLNYSPQYSISGVETQGVISYIERTRRQDQEGMLRMLERNGFGRLR